MIKLIIFDYDGVIVDSFPNVHNVYKIILKELNRKCPESLEEFKKDYGESYFELSKKHELTENEMKKAEEIFRKEILKQETNIFDGMIEVLKEFHKKYKIIVITSNYKEEAESKLKKFDILKYFYKIIGKEHNLVNKHFGKTEEIRKFLQEFGLKEDEVVLIGDRNIDFNEGIKAGLKHIILVDYGWGYDKSKIPLWEQKFVVKQPIDLVEAIRKIQD